MLHACNPSVCHTQDKLLRTLILGCLVQCISTFMYRQGSMPRDRMVKWLTRATKPVLANLKKGNFQFPEQQVCSSGCT